MHYCLSIGTITTDRWLRGNLMLGASTCPFPIFTYISVMEQTKPNNGSSSNSSEHSHHSHRSHHSSTHSSSGERHHHHHHHHEDEAEKFKNHNLNAKRRKKTISRIAFAVMCTAAILITLYVAYIYMFD